MMAIQLRIIIELFEMIIHKDSLSKRLYTRNKIQCFYILTFTAFIFLFAIEYPYNPFYHYFSIGFGSFLDWFW